MCGHADTRDARAARPLPRRAQPAAARHAMVDSSAARPADRLDPALGPTGLCLPGRCAGREGLRQAPAVGRVDLLVRQAAQGLRHACRGAAVVRRRWWLEDPGGVPPLAAQAELRPGCLSDQAAAGARMLTELAAARLPVAYPVADTHYTAGWFTRLASQLGIT